MDWVRGLRSRVEWDLRGINQDTAASTFNMSASEAAPLGPILLDARLMDVTDLFTCQTERFRKGVSSEVTGGRSSVVGGGRGDGKQE